jgi:hypothetical protein
MIGSILFVAVFVAVAFFYTKMLQQRADTLKNEFLEKHPDAVKVYLQSKISIVTEMVQAPIVDGEPAVPFTEPGKLPLPIPGIAGGKGGIHVVPGKRTLDVIYTRTRPGVFYKSVSISTGLVKKEFVFVAGKTYVLGFDRDKEEFTLKETEDAPDAGTGKTA